MKSTTTGPPRTFDSEDHSKPGQQTARCTWWIKRFAAGWRPNRRIRQMGYGAAAKWYGVPVWEYLNVLAPMLRAVKVDV